MRFDEKFEAYCNKQLGTRSTISSGRIFIDKGDGKDKDLTKTFPWFLDAKATQKKSYGIKIETWNKLRHDALDENRYPILPIGFYDELENLKLSLVVIGINDFIAVNDYIIELENKLKEHECQ